MKMLRWISVLCVCVLALLTVSCRRLSPDAKAAAAAAAAAKVDGMRVSQEMAAASRRIEKANLFLKDDKLELAQAEVAPLLGGKYQAEEAGRIADEIKRRQAVADKTIGPKLSALRAIDEVTERFQLPESYGRTVTITGDNTPLEIPPGPMEQLVNRKVSMKLADAKVQAIIDQLTKFDGLNIVADKTLTQKGGDATLSIDVKDVPLREILNYIARNLEIAFHLSENVIWVTENKDEDKSGKPVPETRIYRLRRGFVPGGAGGGAAPSDSGGGAGGGGGGGTDDELFKALDQFVKGDAKDFSYDIFKTRNLLVVKGTREQLRQVELLVREFDKEPQQALIEARFVTIGQTDLKELGTTLNNLAMNARDPKERSIISTFTASDALAGTTAAGSPTTLTLGGILGNHTYQMTVAALEKLGTTKTLSVPRLTVLNNHSANIHKGKNLYYWKEWESDTTNTTTGGTTTQSTTPRPSGEPTELQTGITLDVTANIGNDGKTVMLGLKPSIKDLTGFFTYGTNKNPDPGAKDPASGGTQTTGYQLPIVADQSVITNVVVNSGDTVVLGGTLAATQEDTVDKTPFLGDIPVLKYLFSHHKKTNEPEHLLIFVTATVINPSGEFVKVAEKP